MRTQLSILLGLGAILPACGPAERPDAVRPPLKASPSRVLHVEGEIGGAVTPELEVEYQTTKPDCRVTINKLEGVRSEKIYHHPVPIRRTGSRYEADAPVDLVEPGECGWAPFALNYVLRKDGRAQVVPVPPTPLVWFKEGAPAATAPIRIECEDHRGLFAGGLECSIPSGGYLSLDAPRLDVSFRERPAR